MSLSASDRGLHLDLVLIQEVGPVQLPGLYQLFRSEVFQCGATADGVAFPVDTNLSVLSDLHAPASASGGSLFKSKRGIIPTMKRCDFPQCQYIQCNRCAMEEELERAEELRLANEEAERTWNDPKWRKQLVEDLIFGDPDRQSGHGPKGLAAFFED